MADDLDREALAYMQERHPTFTSRPLSYNPQPQIGGKLKTGISKKEKMAQNKTYISDEPERFEQYIEDIKPTFTKGIDDARQKVIDYWTKDSSLSNLLKGLDDAHVLERELNALLNLEGVRKKMGDVIIAQRIRQKPETFRKNIIPLVVEEKLAKAFRLLQKEPKAKINVLDLVSRTKSGSVKGQPVEGIATTFKIGKSRLVRYRDAKGRFIKLA